MSPAAARRVAKGFDSDEARAADLGWVGDALRECATEIDATPFSEQLRIADEMVAAAQAKGKQQ
ncbi:MAG TPA: hypothetical protein VEA44_16060 [Caulobacter sp.]|nr:hypothetical protein [Caulobacter sp.]